MNDHVEHRHEEDAETPWTFSAASVSGSDSGPFITLVDGSTFAVSDRSGDINGIDTHGLYLSDTRMLDRLVVSIDGARVEPLSVILNGPFSATFVGRTSPEDGHADSPLSVIRRRHVGRDREDLEVRNHSAHDVAIRIDIDAGSDFASLFDVKSGRARHVASAQRQLGLDGISFSNPDETIHTHLPFHPPADQPGLWEVVVPAVERGDCARRSLLSSADAHRPQLPMRRPRHRGNTGAAAPSVAQRRTTVAGRRPEDSAGRRSGHRGSRGTPHLRS